MSRKKVFIENLNDTETSTLKEGWKNGKNYAFRNRCQCILMSEKGYDAEALARLFSVRIRTIYSWLNNWKKYGVIGLITKPGQGRKPRLSIHNEEHVKVVEKAVKNAAENGANMADEIIAKLDIKEGFSNRTLRRYLQKKNYAYKRLRRFTKKKPNKAELKAVLEVLKEVFKLVNQGVTDMYFVDECGFSLTPNLSYAWSPIGIQWGIKSVKKKVLNVLGFLNPKNDHLKIYPLPKNKYMNAEIFTGLVDDFITGITKETVLVLDRAPWHTAALTLSKISEWEEKGLHIVFLPAYSPHYNLIETFWRKIKYEWLKIKDYRSKTALKKKLKSIFQEYGNLYNIKFSMNF